MEHVAGTTHLSDKGFTYANICDLTTTWYQWPPAAHTKVSKALPSTFTQAEVDALVQCFQKGQTTSKPCDKSNNTCNLVERKDIGPMNVQTRLTLQ